MAKYKRMINCDFVNASAFKLKTGNRAKLLYFYMLSSADDKGFIDNVDELIELLDSNDRRFNTESNATLMPDNFETALNELLEKSLIYKFEDRHMNKIYLIKHWYLHNIIPHDRVRDSSYEKYLEQVFVNDDREYEFYDLSHKCIANDKQVHDNCQANDKQVCTQIKENKRKVNKSNNNQVNNNARPCEEINDSLENDGLDIPKKWTQEQVSKGLSLRMKAVIESLNEREQAYLDAFEKMNQEVKEDDKLF